MKTNGQFSPQHNNNFLFEIASHQFLADYDTKVEEKEEELGHSLLSENTESPELQSVNEVYKDMTESEAKTGRALIE